jgi:O-acetyl-ADP-ribose deacetylase (regulator of RNase III)
MVNLHVVRADITTLQVDAIVNAASPRMRGGGGVDGAIHAAAGPGLLAECVERFPDGLATGDAGLTTGHLLPARWVIHVVGPDRRAGQHDPALLASCYTRALEVADDLGAASVAFPLVSAGIYAWPLDDAADIAVASVRAARTQVAEVTFAAFSEAADRALTTRL